MTRNMFRLIKGSLKAVDDLFVITLTKNYDNVWKMRPLIDVIRERWQQMPGQKCVAGDETIVPFQEQFTPRKPNQHDFKGFVMATTFGLLLDLGFYQGEENITHSIAISGLNLMTLTN